MSAKESKCCYQSTTLLCFYGLFALLFSHQKHCKVKMLKSAWDTQGKSRQSDTSEQQWIFPTSRLKRSCAMKEKHSNSIMRANEDNFCTRERKCCLQVAFPFPSYRHRRRTLQSSFGGYFNQMRMKVVVVTNRGPLSNIISLEIYFHNQLIEWIYLFKAKWWWILWNVSFFLCAAGEWIMSNHLGGN